MKFPAAIPRTIPPKFHTASDQRSLRDADSLPRQHIRHSVASGQQASDTGQIAQAMRQIMRMRFRKPQDPEDQLPAMFPFKIYAIDNQTATAEQRQYFKDKGADINNFTFQVRSGIVGWRSKYENNLNQNFQNSTFEIGVECSCTDGRYYFNVGAPPAANTDGPTVMLSNFVDTIIPDGCQVALEPTQDGLGSISASFYIKVTDEPNYGATAQLYGRMFTQDVGALYRQFGRLPTYRDSSIFLLGTIEAYTGFGPDYSGVSQYQFGNLVNRFTTLSPLGSPLGPVNVQRGYWVADSLSGQVFYFGDIVIDDSTPVYVNPTDGAKFYGVYTYIGSVAAGGSIESYIAVITYSPYIEPGVWKMTGTVIIP